MSLGTSTQLLDELRPPRDNDILIAHGDVRHGIDPVYLFPESLLNRDQVIEPVPVPRRIVGLVYLLDRREGEAAVVHEDFGRPLGRRGLVEKIPLVALVARDVEPLGERRTDHGISSRHPAPGLFLGIGVDRPAVEGGDAETWPDMETYGRLHE